MKQSDDYLLLDSGDGAKLERFGAYILERPCSQAVWKKSGPTELWQKAHAKFTRIDDKRWTKQGNLPESWNITTEGIAFKLSMTDFGHLGIFAEQRRSAQVGAGEPRSPGPRGAVVPMSVFAR